MFSSAVLDLAIGLIFTFLAVSLATGAIVEAIASVFKVRATTLWRGIGQLLNDPKYYGLASEIYSHAAINPRSDGTARPIRKWDWKNPAYIDRQLFGQAMLDVLKISPEIANAAKNPNAPLGKPTVVELKTAVCKALQDAANAIAKASNKPNAPVDDQLKTFLNGIIERSLGDPDKIKGELVAWFDNAMDRVSGWYKRWTQLIGFIVALILAVGLNIDATKVAEVLWTQPKLAAELIKNLPAGGVAATPPAKQEEASAATLHSLDTTLPVGWQRGFWLNDAGSTLNPDEFGIAFIGWLITALSTLFGAPFWFDLLQTGIRLKGSGPSPKEKADEKGAAA